MTKLKGFWSYVRDDDVAELNRISRLAKDVVAQYEMISGDSIDLFLDFESIQLGEDWRKSIQENLTAAVFFIPVLTPRYFLSNACVGELREFSRGAKKLGIDELIISLIYVDVPGFFDENSENELFRLIKTFEYEDWRDLRFFEVDSEGYRRGVHKLALRLFEANRKLEVSTSQRVYLEGVKNEDEEDDGEPGILEVLAKYEEQISLMPDTLRTITENINHIGRIIRESTENIQRADAQGKGFSARLANIKRTAELMNEPTETIWLNSNIYASQINYIDQAFRIIIEQASHEIESDPESKSTICENFNNIHNLSESAQVAVENINNMIRALEPLEKYSRDMKPVARKLRDGLILMVDSTTVTNYWVDLIKETGIECDEPSSIDE